MSDFAPRQMSPAEFDSAISDHAAATKRVPHNKTKRIAIGWRPEEDAILYRCAGNKEAERKLAARGYQRSAAGIRHRRSTLGLTGPERKEWGDTEHAILLACRRQDKTIDEAWSALKGAGYQRSRNGVKTRYNKLSKPRKQISFKIQDRKFCAAMLASPEWKARA